MTIHRSEQHGDRDKIWKQTLEDNLLKPINQNKADAAISELQHKEKLKLWKQEHKIQEFIEQHEQQKEKFKTWKCCLEETLELNTWKIMDQKKRQKDEDGRQELEKMLEQRMRHLTDRTEQQRENKKDWKQGLEENLLKLINQNKINSRTSELQY